jgi:AmpE protein
MNLIALLIGLGIERLATQLFHLRELRWLDHIIDWGFRQTARHTSWPALIPVLLLVALLVLPLFIVIWSLRDTLSGLTHLGLSVIVLFFSLGPKDIGEEVDEYCDALEAEDDEAIQHAAKAIVEADVPDDPLERIHRVEEAVCVQANNRLFAVIFWFILAGPLGALGAWTYRVTDLVRRRAVFNATREDEEAEITAPRVRDAAIRLHGWLAWIPARLTAFGYAAAGHFDEAITALRAPDEDKEGTLSEHSDRLLARVGVAALALQDKPDESMTDRGVKGARSANHLVFRLFVIWAVLISAMTLYGLTQ